VHGAVEAVAEEIAGEGDFLAGDQSR